MKDKDLTQFENELEKRLASTDWDFKISSSVIRRKKKQRIQYVAGSIAGMALIVLLAGFFVGNRTKNTDKLMYEQVFADGITNPPTLITEPENKISDANHAEVLELAGFIEPLNIDKEVDSDGDLDDLIFDTLASR
ncbi:hypothetical protein KKF34_11760 [Myxococcota bacterium]|nr:hypothetical protein [Myxococcota bacterium]MBU1497540.1 hypothetical protein [Myxococcota bacterium]